MPSTNLRVLLLSPLAGRDPLSGDTTYTESLLAHPPEGVTYVPYDEALESGLLVLRGRAPWRHRPIGPIDVALFLVRMLEALVRRTGLGFREPWWFVTISPEAVDLVHQHLFSVRQVGPRMPVFSSSGFPLEVLYRHREKWSKARVRLASAIELAGSRLLRVHVPWLHGVAPAYMSNYTGAGVNYLAARGWPRVRATEIGTGLGPLEPTSHRHETDQVLFVGRDFERKGGPQAVAAMAALRQRVRTSRLVVVTSEARPPSCPSWVTWRTDVSRVEIINEILPRATVLLAPTNADCGAPYGVLEALQRGVPVVLARSEWLDDRLDGAGVLRVEASASALADAVESLLAPPVWEAASSAAQNLWSESFSMDVLGEQLRAGYGRALSSEESA